MEKKKDSFFLNKSFSKQQNKAQNNESSSNKNIQNNQVKRSKEFDKKRDLKPAVEAHYNEIDQQEKKVFDKKTYRLKKYSKKYKLEQWEEQRKKRLLRDLKKDINNDLTTGTYKANFFDEDITDSIPGKYVRHPDILEKEKVANKRDPFQKAKAQFHKVKQEKEVKRQEIQKAKEEKQQKLQEYKQKKHERFKKLSKKNKKGQPMMTGRLELLLEKIQKGSN